MVLLEVKAGSLFFSIALFVLRKQTSESETNFGYTNIPFRKPPRKVPNKDQFTSFSQWGLFKTQTSSVAGKRLISILRGASAQDTRLCGTNPCDTTAPLVSESAHYIQWHTLWESPSGARLDFIEANEIRWSPVARKGPISFWRGTFGQKKMFESFSAMTEQHP